MAMDPYVEWLQIPRRGRPLTHYELLGLQVFEGDSQRIAAAYGQRYGNISRYKVGKYENQAQQVLADLSAAYACLSHPAAKQAYDDTLRQTTTLADPVTASTRIEPTTPADPRPIPSPRVLSTQLIPDATAPTTPTAPITTKTAPVSAPAHRAAERRPDARDKTQLKRHRINSPRTSHWWFAFTVGIILIAAIVIGLGLSGNPAAGPIALAPAKLSGGNPQVQSTATASPDTEKTTSRNGTEVGPSIPSPARPGRVAGFDDFHSLLGRTFSVGDQVKFIGELGTIHRGYLYVGNDNEMDRRKVKVLFPELSEFEFSRNGYQSDSRAPIQVEGVVTSVERTGDYVLTLDAIKMQRVGQPSSLITGTESPTAGGTAPPLANASKPLLPASSTPTATPSPAAVPDGQEFATFDQAWSDFRNPERVDGRLFHLAGRVERASGNGQGSLRVVYGKHGVTMDGPFRPEGIAFLRQLIPQDAVEFEVLEAGSIALIWMKRLSDAPENRVVFNMAALRASFAAGESSTTISDVKSLAWSPDGTTLAIGREDVLLCSAATGDRIDRLTLDTLRCAAITWSPDSKALAGMSFARTTIVHLDKNQRVATGEVSKSSPRSVAFHPQEPLVAMAREATNVSSGVNTVSVWNWATVGSPLEAGPAEDSSEVAWSADGTLLGWTDGTRVHWVRRNTKGAWITQNNLEFTARADALWWLPNKQLTVLTAGRIVVRDPARPKAPPKVTVDVNLSTYAPDKVSWSSDFNLVAIAHEKAIEVWSLDTPDAPLVRHLTDRNWCAVCWSPKLDRLAGLDLNDRVTIWDRRGDVVSVLRNAAESSPPLMAWSPDGNQMLTINSKDLARIWDIPTP